MQKGFSQIFIILTALLLLGTGFYAGIKSQNLLVSKVEESQNKPESSIEPSSTPKATGKAKASSAPTSKPTITTSPTQNPVSPPAPTPAPTTASTNTSDSNAPTFIIVISPNGGENFKAEDSIHITWSSNNLYKNGSCIITLAYDNGSKSTKWVPVNTPNGYYDWKLTSESAGKQAKVDMQCYSSDRNFHTDQSDNYFIITN